MEVNKAIKIISQLFNSDWDNDVDENGISYKKTREDLISLLKSLESENKKLKQENEAYRGMWEALWDVLELCTIYDSKRKGIQTYAEVILPELEQKYLGGGE